MMMRTIKRSILYWEPLTITCALQGIKDTSLFIRKLVCMNCGNQLRFVDFKYSLYIYKYLYIITPIDSIKSNWKWRLDGTTSTPPQTQKSQCTTKKYLHILIRRVYNTLSKRKERIYTYAQSYGGSFILESFFFGGDKHILFYLIIK